jgi:pantoate--beta-alanine ligase
LEILATAAQLRQRLDGARRVAFVPTMGNLHAGHVSLMRHARALGDTVVASIFVNRLQFAPNEDFERYPRTFDADCAALRAAGVEVLFAPRDAEMYPAPQRFRVAPPPLAGELEGAFRPGFFEGVCTVVLKLFNVVAPDVAVFGMKDRQQLVIVQRMVREFNLPIEVVAGETVRDIDGLALSSRNSYLSAREREDAPALHRALRDAATALSEGRSDYATMEAEAADALRGRGWKVDYVAIRAGSDLALPSANSNGSDLVVLGAATLGTTRLIDNLAVADVPGDGARRSR